eukprot:gene25995-34595_t
MDDSRFSAFLNTPLFRGGKKGKKYDSKDNDAVIDERFQGITEATAKKGGSKVDQYGRKIKKKNSIDQKEAAELKEFYDANNSKEKKKSSEKKYDSRLEYLNLIARGEIDVDSDDSEEENETDDDDQVVNSDEEVDDEEGKLINQQSSRIAMDETVPSDSFSGTNRLAIKNCDWENVSSRDLLIILESFLPTGKTVKSVTVFISDFGRKAMDEEAKFGPRSIWKESAQPADSSEHEGGDSENSVSDSDSGRESEADDDGEDGDEEVDDIYDFIEDDEGGSINSNDGAGDNDPAIAKGKSQRGSSSKGEFKRVGQRDRSVGLVFHQDLVRLGKTRSENDNTSVNNSVASQETGQVVTGGGLDEQALREYELRKLKYYFAIAECDTIETAAALYDQLDGAELEHSSMALDLSFVPEEVSFDGREVRDRSRGGDGSTAATLAGYKPPDFVVEALQHSKVKCSWDKGDTERERKLTNFSHWRDLNESELQQYIASSSDDSDSEEVAVVDSHAGKAKKKQSQVQLRAAEEARKKLKATSKKAKAAQLRRQLLGLQDGDGNRDGDGEERDDFFGSDAGDNNEDGDGDDDSGEVHEMSYMPEDGGDEDDSGSIIGDQDKNTALKKMGKKKHRRGKEESDDDGNPNPFPAIVEDDDTRRKREAQLELLFEGEENGDSRDFNMRDILHTQKEKEKKNGKKFPRGSSSENRDEDKDENAPSKKKSKKSKKVREEAASSDSFQLDLSDSRFQPLFEDPKFGIDITQPEFKSTAVMKDVLQEQTKRKRRQQQEGSKTQAQKRERNTASSYGSSSIDPDPNPRSSEIDVSTLVSKLKRKLQATN